MRGFDTDISTQAYRVNGFSHGYSTSPNASAMDGRGESALSGLIIFLGPHSQGVALGYLIPPRWGLNLITLSHILLELLFLKAMLSRWGLKLISLLYILLKILFLQAMLSPLGLKTDFVITNYRLARKRKRIPNLEPLSRLIFASDLVFAPKGHNEIAQGNALGK